MASPFSAIQKSAASAASGMKTLANRFSGLSLPSVSGVTATQGTQTGLPAPEPPSATPGTATGTPLSVQTYNGPGPDVNPYVAPQSLKELGSKAQGNMSAASDVINNQLTGKAYDPYALQAQQALGRAEANQRAKTASAIHSSGFSGTPLGASAGNAVESDLMRNRFDTNLGIEVERQNMMNTGVGNAMKYGDAVSQLQTDDLARAKSVFDLDRTKWDWEDGKIDTATRREAEQLALGAAKRNDAQDALSLAHSNWTGSVLGDFDFLSQLDKAGTPMAQELAVANYLSAHPDVAQWLRQSGIDTPAKALTAISNARKGADTGFAMRTQIKQIFPNYTDAEIDKVIERIFGEEIGIGKEEDNTVGDLISGDKNLYDTPISSTDDPHYKELAAKAPPITGKTTATDLKMSMNNRTPVSYNGKVYTVTSVRGYSSPRGPDYGLDIWVLADIATGETIELNTWASGKGKGNIKQSTLEK